MPNPPGLDGLIGLKRNKGADCDSLPLCVRQAIPGWAGLGRQPAEREWGRRRV